MLELNIWQVFFNGMGISAFYALFAVGLTLIFGVMKIINFAYGELYMVGAYLTWFVITVGSGLLPIIVLFFLGLVVAVLVVGGLSLGIERGLFRPVRRKLFPVFMISLGLLYILRVSASQIFGAGETLAPTVFPGMLKLFTGLVSIRMLVIIVSAVILLGGLWFFLERTKVGRAIRASSQDIEAAALQGIGINRMSALVMGIGGMLAAAAGGLVGTSLLLTPYIGWFVLWKAFIVTIVGGLGSVEGAIMAALLFGFLDNLVTTLGEPQMVIMIDVLIMLLILAFRPQGLLGREK